MKPLNAIGTVLLVSLTLLSAASVADLYIANSAQDTRPLMAGDRAPAFTVYEVDGTEFTFDPNSLERPALLITFRGGWCPYCNAQLSGLRNVLPDITNGGMDILFLSGDRPELLYASLRQDTQDGMEGLGYRILSDANMTAASALGIAFKVPAETRDSFSQQGRDITDSSMDLHGALPVPAVFVVGTDGTIIFSHANPDFRVRLPAEEVKAAAEPLLTTF